MSRFLRWFAGALFVATTAACGGADAAADHEHAEGEADHEHTADGEHLPAAPLSPRQGGAVTLHTDSVELFLEHPALSVGALERFSVHLTDATDFTPLASGAVTFRFVPRDGGSPVVVSADAPRSPGHYGPVPDFARAGLYDLSILVNSPQAIDSLFVPGLEVYARAVDAPAALPPDTTGIAFTKEQQWATAGFRLSPATAVTQGTGVQIPTSAILTEDSKRVAYVQRAGEHFEKRILTLAGAAGAFTTVTAGIAPGEYVVSGAAADLRRETLSPADRAHGHSH